MRVLILGGTGFVGKHLQEVLKSKGLEVVAFGREAFQVGFDLRAALEDSDILINLMGENVAQRWTEQHKSAMRSSRLDTLDKIAELLKLCNTPPTKIISASAVGIYRETDLEHPQVESDALEVGDNFLSELAIDWEQKSLALIPTPVVFRFGVVLGQEGGALQKMALPFKLGLGGPVAGGQQVFSWIHIEDLCRVIALACFEDSFSGIYNLTAPNPVTNDVFGRAFAELLQRPYWLPVFEWQLKLMFGEGSQVLTTSINAVPERLLQEGIVFKYPTIKEALASLV